MKYPHYECHAFSSQCQLWCHSDILSANELISVPCDQLKLCVFVQLLLPVLQVAEMHGELMEFNEHLQKQLLNREHNIRRLRHELVSLRGPVSMGQNTCN